MLLCAAIASVAVAIPILLDYRNWIYSVLILIVSGALGVFIGLGNVIYVAPIVAFCMPFAIVKSYGESIRVTAQVEETTTLEDPFNQGDDKRVVAVKLDGRKCLPTWLKWVLYYALLEIAIGLTLLCSYLFMPTFFDALIANKWFYAVLAAAQLIVIPYDLLMRGCFIGTVKIIHKAIRN